MTVPIEMVERLIESHNSNSNSNSNSNKDKNMSDKRIKSFSAPGTIIEDVDMSQVVRTRKNEANEIISAAMSGSAKKITTQDKGETDRIYARLSGRRALRNLQKDIGIMREGLSLYVYRISK